MLNNLYDIVIRVSIWALQIPLLYSNLLVQTNKSQYILASLWNYNLINSHSCILDLHNVFLNMFIQFLEFSVVIYEVMTV